LIAMIAAVTIGKLRGRREASERGITPPIHPPYCPDRAAL